MARAIGPSGRGETAATIALAYIVPVLLGMGVPLELRRLAATTDVTAALRAARRLGLLTILPATAVAVALYASLFSDFGQAARLVASLNVALCPLMLSWTLDLSVLVARGRFRNVLVLQLTQPSIYLLAIVVLWVTHTASTATVLASNLVGTAATCIAGLFMTRVKFRGERSSYGSLLRGGVKFAGSSVSEIASNKLDQVLVLPLIGSVGAGLYAVAVTVASVPLAFGQALGASYFTPIARASGTERRELQTRSVRAGIAMGLMTCPPLGLIAWVGIPVVFGKEFTSAVPVAGICLAGSVALVTNFVCSMALAASGQGVRMTVSQVTALAVAIGALLVLGPAWGAKGAATASSIGYFVLMSMLLLSLRMSPLAIAPRPRDFKEAIRQLVRGER